MTLNLEAIKARCEKATAGHTCTETPYGCLRCESETDSLDAECLLLVAEVERLRKVEAAARAWREVFRSPPKLRTPHNHRSYSHAVSNARCRVFAALDAAQGGG